MRTTSQSPGSDVLSVLESQRLQMLQLFAGRSERTAASGMLREMDGQGSSRTRHGYRTHFCLPACASRGPIRRRSPVSSRMTTCGAARLAADPRRSCEEFGAVRSASISLFRSFKEDVWARGGRRMRRRDRAGAGLYYRGPPDTPPHHSGRALLSSHSARLSHRHIYGRCGNDRRRSVDTSNCSGNDLAVRHGQPA